MFKNSLSDLFPEEDRVEYANDKPVLLVDGHNMAYRTLHSAIFQHPEDNVAGGFAFWKHLFMSSFLKTVKTFSPKKIILTFDVKNSWRYDVYSLYKSTRKKARAKNVIDFESFFPVFNEIISDLKKTFENIYIIQIDKCEADDVIAILTKKIFLKDKIVIVSTDKDFHQLIDNQNIQQYDPILSKVVKCINPSKELSVKLLIGDPGDGIPNVKAQVGPATAEAILKRGLEDYLYAEGNEQILENYKRNQILIDFNYIPKYIEDNIINTYNDYKITNIDSMKLMSFFTRNKLMKIMTDWQNYEDYIKTLT